ncbi:MOSC domain-containing protein [Streptomyces sp. NPDC054887]
MPNSLLHAVHVYPVKSVTGYAPGEVRVEPWGPAGDRRWMLVDPAGKVVTQRPQPRLALARAEPLPDGGIRLSAPGREPLVVAVPDPGLSGTTGVQLWKDKVEVVEAGAGAHAWFSAYLETEVRLVHLDDPSHRRPVAPAHGKPGETVSFADAYPLLVTSLSSLDALNSLIAQGDHADEGPLAMSRFRPNAVVDGTAPWAEDGWKRVAIGEVTFRVTEPCARCVVTTTDQRTAERGKEPLRTLARHRRAGDKLLFGQNLVPEVTGTVRVGDPVRILE